MAFGRSPISRWSLPTHFPPRKWMKRVRFHSQRTEVSDAILDGEICALDGTGRPTFYDLMKRRCQAVYYAFDILWLNGRDLRELSLLQAQKDSAFGGPAQILLDR